MSKIYGYKGFNIKEDGTLFCQPGGSSTYTEYKLGEVAEVKGELKLCQNGIHFCRNLNDVYDFYNFNYKYVVVGKVEILGNIIDGKDNQKSCTNKLKLVRLYKTKAQLMNVSNTGNRNTGYCNTGYCNTGDCNTGDCNTGNRNTGYCNTGDCNTGDCNTGDCNTGNRNTGYCNTGNRNTGDCNTGDWNSCNFSNGLFNTKSPKINLFNKPTKYTMEEFRQTHWYNALTNGYFQLTKWVDYTEEEMKADERKRNTGGRTVAIDYKVACDNWWHSLSQYDRDIIQTMPNFNAKIFKEITGIDVKKGE